MGWLYQRDPVDDPVAYMMAKYNYDCNTHTLQSLDCARVGNTVYLAVRSTVKATARSFVFAAVILISNTKKDGFGYKDQDEGMGPCQYACPERITRLLSPIGDLPHPGHTADWRAGVAAHKLKQHQLRELRRSLRIGSTVTLPTPVRFPGGSVATQFLVARFRRKTPIFMSLDGPQFYCRLRASTLTAATITPLQTSDPDPPAV